MQNSRNNKTVWIAGTFLLMLAFQNCSGVEFAALSPEEIAGGGGSPDHKSDNGREDVDDDDRDTSANPIEIIGSGSYDMPGGQAASVYRTACSRLRPEHQDRMQLLAPGSDINNKNDTIFVEAESLGTVKNHSGGILIAGLGSGGTVAALVDSYGDTMICGLDLALIRNHSKGRIIVVGGDVGDIENTSAQIVVVDGRITGAKQNATGTIMILR